MEIVINVIRRFIKGANKNNISVYAAGSAFYWILSIVPIVIVISNIIAFTGLTEEILLEALIQFFPARAQKKLSVLVHFIYNNSMHMLPVAIFFAIWSAGRGMLAIMRGLNEINDIVEKRNYFKLRIISSFYMFILLFGLVFTLIIAVFGKRIWDMICTKLPLYKNVMRIGLKSRYILAIMILSVIFTIIYTYVPNVKTSIKSQYLGGVLAAAGCTVFSYMFAFYVDHYNDFSQYGSISIIIILMLWLYISIYIFLYGAYFVRFFVKEINHG